MSDFIKARDLIRGAEASLLEIMRRALAEGRYCDLAEVAPLASALSNALRSSKLDGTARMPPEANKTDASRQMKRTAFSRNSRSPTEKAAQKGDGYPRFERDGDKLVKIGWSKKDHAEYEHRVPRKTILRVAEVLNSKSGPGKVFAMDRLLPLSNSDGSEIPSYQAYLALAWFRMLGIVEERGKEGYEVVGGALGSSRLDDAWNATQPRD
jgi:hypothetical protein